MSADRSPRPLRILFSMRNFWFLRLFESVLRELAARGHVVHVLADHSERRDEVPDWEAVSVIARDWPNVTFDWASRQTHDEWVDLRLIVRFGLDYLRFLGPAYVNAPILRKRAQSRTPAAIVALSERPFWRTRVGWHLMRLALGIAERAIPCDQALAAEIAAQRADLVLITPLVTLGSEQQDVLRISRALGVPATLCVASWDHLSSKAMIRTLPDRMLVWNERQRREAIELHGVDENRIVVTGAQCFDVWFDRRPALDRETFCRKVGLRPDRPFILYACSALFEGSPIEAEFVVRWIETIRSSGHAILHDAGILVRPHPRRGSEWDHVDLSRFDNVSLWPPVASPPIDDERKADYFDSLYHSVAIVGVNTSALIEGGIVGRPVHTVLLPEFFDNQEGTLHFHYLLEGGLLRVARDLPSHAAQLAASLTEGGATTHANRSFVERFVRPRGLDVPATPVFVDTVERLARTAVPRRRDAFWVPAVRSLLRPLARRTLGTFDGETSKERRYREAAERRARAVAALEAQRAAEVAEKIAARQARLAAAEARRQAAMEADRRAADERRAARERQVLAEAEARAAKIARKVEARTRKQEEKAVHRERHRRGKRRQQRMDAVRRLIGFGARGKESVR